jgi:taurine dioxygenase
MSDWISRHGLRWRTFAPFGVEVDTDLAQPMSEATASSFVDLLYENGLVVARGQTLSMDRQTTLMQLIGPIVRRPQENGYISTDNDEQASRTELSFHADGAYTSSPFAALSLHAIDVVNGASSTRFVNADRAYATLPAALRDRLDKAHADMISPTLEGVGIRASEMRDAKASLHAEFPAVRVNPRTGRRCIGVSEMHTAGLLDMPWEESRDLLGAVFDHLYAAANTVEHFWNVGDLVVWDNLTLQHARGSLMGVGRRVLQRVVAGAAEEDTDMAVFLKAAQI